ncbi:hypothetical protein NLJ89_g9685 [Agrocybe chaxingu]|uniref:Uncharacterized protein n=1 Tax=Agrocybe chaxingu TaxID=84603 RepID=A0A9W8MQZ3_9AGAR|nr:hypothetical protein NLJ89_g9685 [Agrocybe chaxingu]
MKFLVLDNYVVFATTVALVGNASPAPAPVAESAIAEGTIATNVITEVEFIHWLTTTDAEITWHGEKAPDPLSQAKKKVPSIRLGDVTYMSRSLTIIDFFPIIQYPANVAVILRVYESEFACLSVDSYYCLQGPKSEGLAGSDARTSAAGPARLLQPMKQKAQLPTPPRRKASSHMPHQTALVDPPPSSS